MRITLHTIGGLDEVLPLAALGQALQEHGHSVLLCVPEKFRERMMKRNLRMISCGASFEEFLEGGTPSESQFLHKLTAEVPVHFVSLRDALREADVLIGGLLPLAAPSMAEQLSLPYLQIITSPLFLERSEFPAPGALPRSGILSGLEKKSRARQWDRQLRNAIDRERSFSGSAPLKDLYSYFFASGHQVIAVAAELMPEVKLQNGTITGFWFTEEEIPLEKEWQDFFESGSPVAFVGPVQDPQSLQNSLTAAGFRTLFSADWKDHKSLNQDASIFPGENQVPPRAAVAIHSGLTRMTVAALRSGVPQVIAPRVAVQADWGRRIEMQEAGIVTTHDADAIAAAAQRIVNDSRFQEFSRSLSEKIAERNSLEAAIQTIAENISGL